MGRCNHQRFGLIKVARNQIARLIFAKQGLRVGRVERNANTRCIRHFERGQGKAPVGQIGTGFDHRAVVADKFAMGFFGCQIDAWRIAIAAVEHFKQQGRLTQMALCRAQNQRHMAFADVFADDVVDMVQQTHSADGGGGQNAFAVRFVIQRHVARHDGHVQRRHGFADAFDRADELAHDLGLFGVAKVHVVGCRQGTGPDGTQVAIGFGDGLFAPLKRVGFDIARRHIRGKGDGLVGAMHPHNA